MMSLEEQHITFDQARELQKLGVTAEGYHEWRINRMSGKPEIAPWFKYDRETKKVLANAYSCAELGEMLAQIKTHHMEIKSILDGFSAYLRPFDIRKGSCYCANKSAETWAKCELLKVAIKRKLIKPEDLKL